MEKIKTVEELLSEARTIYFNARRDRIDPLSPQWTEIAGGFQRAIRIRLALGDPDSLRLKYVMLYFHRLNRMLRLGRPTQCKEFAIQSKLSARMKRIAISGSDRGRPVSDFDDSELNYIIAFG